MSKIISIKKAIKICKSVHANNKTIVIAGGCFDILHAGHIKFLKQAKKQGNILIILLESDESVKKLKGDNRPINQLLDRAEILAAVEFVDYIIPLEGILTNNDWDKLIFNLDPDIIAVTKKDPQIIHNKRQAEKINAKIVEVIARIDNKSSTKLAQLIEENF